jgi:hypothetical protein
MSEYFCSPKQAEAISNLVKGREKVACHNLGLTFEEDKTRSEIALLMRQRYPHDTDYLDEDAIRREFNPRQASSLIGLLLNHSTDKVLDYIRLFIQNKEKR